MDGNQHSLAAVAGGESFHVQRILFDGLRSHCADLGIHEGDGVRCRASAPSILVLEVPGGRVISLERDWARFVEVSDIHPAARCC